MAFLFRIWFSATILSLVVYVPTYFIANDAIDAVDELTANEMIPMTGMTNRDPAQFTSLLRKIEVDTSTTFVDALENNEHFSDVDVEYIDNEQANQIEYTAGLKVVAIVAKIDNTIDFRLSFAVLPKRFARNLTGVASLVAMEIAQGDRNVNLLRSHEDEFYIWGLLSSNEQIQNDVVNKMKQKLHLTSN